MPAAMLVFHTEARDQSGSPSMSFMSDSRREFESVADQSWKICPPGMTPRMTTGSTAVSSQYTFTISHCCQGGISSTQVG